MRIADRYHVQRPFSPKLKKLQQNLEILQSYMNTASLLFHWSPKWSVPMQAGSLSVLHGVVHAIPRIIFKPLCSFTAVVSSAGRFPLLRMPRYIHGSSLQMGMAKRYITYSLVFTSWIQFAQCLQVSCMEHQLQVKTKNGNWFSSGEKTEQKSPCCDRRTPQLWAGSNTSVYVMKFIHSYLLFLMCYSRWNSMAWTVLTEGISVPVSQCKRTWHRSVY